MKKHPKVLLNPFSYLKELYDNLGDIEYNSTRRIDSQNQLVSINYLVTTSKARIGDAIIRYEKVKSTEPLLSPEDLIYKSLVFNMMECILTYNFDAIEKEVEKMLNSSNVEFFEISSFYYDSWGNYLLQKSRAKSDLVLLEQAMNKFEKANKINPAYEMSLVNWAIALQDKAKMMSDIKFYQESFNKLDSSVKINSVSTNAYFVWGRGFEALAKLTNKRSDYCEATDKYSWVLKYEPNNLEALISYAECNTQLGIFDNDPFFFRGF